MKLPGLFVAMPQGLWLVSQPGFPELHLRPDDADSLVRFRPLPLPPAEVPAEKLAPSSWKRGERREVKTGLGRGVRLAYSYVRGGQTFGQQRYLLPWDGRTLEMTVQFRSSDEEAMTQAAKVLLRTMGPAQLQDLR